MVWEKEMNMYAIFKEYDNTEGIIAIFSIQSILLKYMSRILHQATSGLLPSGIYDAVFFLFLVSFYFNFR